MAAWSTSMPTATTFVAMAKKTTAWNWYVDTNLLMKSLPGPMLTGTSDDLVEEFLRTLCACCIRSRSLQSTGFLALMTLAVLPFLMGGAMESSRLPLLGPSSCRGSELREVLMDPLLREAQPSSKSSWKVGLKLMPPPFVPSLACRVETSRPERPCKLVRYSSCVSRIVVSHSSKRTRSWLSSSCSTVSSLWSCWSGAGDVTPPMRMIRGTAAPGPSSGNCKSGSGRSRNRSPPPLRACSCHCAPLPRSLWRLPPLSRSSGPLPCSQ
mmetsp:Transcript_78496/g.177273  ORF Transcript_78496/g.177273 Transcript_78496/m.177273 type:complete len:267 (-) Transcript_78496:114-914(-)